MYSLVNLRYKAYAVLKQSMELIILDPRNTIKFDGSASSKKNTPVRKVLHEIVNHQLPNEGNTLVHLDAPGKKSETDILL